MKASIKATCSGDNGNGATLSFRLHRAPEGAEAHTVPAHGLPGLGEAGGGPANQPPLAQTHSSAGSPAKSGHHHWALLPQGSRVGLPFIFSLTSGL